jgi:catechol 2,3-dioxygenase-like lactoylglutathione lyase family enzyme
VFSKVDYVMVRVSDMRRSVAFYRDTLGLPLKFESPEWSEFATGATTLALHASHAASPEFEHRHPVRRRPGEFRLV